MLEWRDALMGFSFANLCYFRVWSALLTFTWADTYLMKRGPLPADFAACVLNVLLLGAAMTALFSLARRKLHGEQSAIARWSLLVLLLVPLNSVRSVLVNYVPYLHRYVLIQLFGLKTVVLVGLAVAGLGLVAVLRWQRRLARIAGMLLLALFPFVPLNFAQALWKSAHYNPAAFADKPLAPLLAGARRTPRVVWMVCDEWDQRLTFLERIPGLELAALDRLRRESLYADHAYPPSGQTAWSLPALITGRLVADVKPLGPDELLLKLPPPAAPVRWSQQPNIFSAARAAGFNTAAVGYYHPYGRVLNRDLSFCWWRPTALEYNSMGDSFGRILVNQARSLLENEGRSPFGQSLAVKEHARIYQTALRHSKELVANPEMGFILLHLPVPHAPHPYNRATGQFNLKNPISGYYDSLALLNRTLAELRATMEQAGLWDRTTLLMSSDHWNRSSQLLDGKKDHRVPFLLKLAGEKQGVAYDAPFNTVLTHDLLLAILRGEISDAAGVARWLDRHRSIQDSPYSYDDPTV